MAPQNKTPVKKCHWVSRDKAQPEGFETTTGTYHRYIPTVPQNFDCRVKATLAPNVLEKEITLGKEQFKTNYREEYVYKRSHSFKNPKISLQDINSLRTVEEKYYATPPPPIAPRLSEFKSSYRANYFSYFPKEVEGPPVETSYCYITKLGCEQQPAIAPEKKGFWRWTDPYFTTYKAAYVVPYEVGDAITEKTLTFYNEDEFSLPLKSGNQMMFDRALFKTGVVPNRILPKFPKRVPSFGMNSEYRDKYIKQTYSDVYPFMQGSCTIYEDFSVPPTSREQSCAAPGMYCSEYCHLGGWPVRCVIEPSKPKKEIKRTKNCCKLMD